MTNKEIIEVLLLMSLQYLPRTTEYKALNEAIDKLRENEPKKGEWKYHKAEDVFLPYMECTACGLEYVFDNENITPKKFRKYYKYCPNCGARMEKDND